MIKIKTEKVLHNLGNIFKMNTFLIISSRAVFRTQSKVYGGAYIANSPIYIYIYIYKWAKRTKKYHFFYN